MTKTTCHGMVDYESKFYTFPKFMSFNVSQIIFKPVISKIMTPYLFLITLNKKMTSKNSYRAFTFSSAYSKHVMG